MGRYTPTVLPDPGPSFEDMLEQAFLAIDRKHARDEMERRRKREATMDEERREEREVRLHERGYRRGEAPTKEATLDVGSEGPIRVPAYEPRIGMQGDTQENPLAQALGDLQEENRATIAALPGQFIPETGGFTRQAILKVPPPRLGTRGEQVPTPRVTDPRYDQVTEDLYLDTEETPQARAAEATRAEADRRRSQERRYELEDEFVEREAQNALAEALGALPHVSGEQAEAVARGAPAGVVFPKEREDRRLDYSIAENRARGSARGWLGRGTPVETAALYVQEQNPGLDPRDALRITYEVQAEIDKENEDGVDPRTLDLLGWDAGEQPTGSAATVAGDRPSLQDRIAELKRRGVGRDEAYATLLREGYIEEEQP